MSIWMIIVAAAWLYHLILHDCILWLNDKPISSKPFQQKKDQLIPVVFWFINDIFLFQSGNTR